MTQSMVQTATILSTGVVGVLAFLLTVDVFDRIDQILGWLIHLAVDYFVQRQVLHLVVHEDRQTDHEAHLACWRSTGSVSYQTVGEQRLFQQQHLM